MKVVVGLGNPGHRYEKTPHNLGFEVADRLAERWGLKFSENARARAWLAEGLMAGQPTILVKPMTFMNLSGEAVDTVVRQRELGEDDLVVITDDVNLPIGRLRIRPQGSHGGHNGLRSIINRLGHDRFVRLRIGIKPTWPVEDLVAFVLQKLPALERQQLADMVEASADAIECWAKQGCKTTAGQVNGLTRFAAEP